LLVVRFPSGMALVLASESFVGRKYISVLLSNLRRLLAITSRACAVLFPEFLPLHLVPEAWIAIVVAPHGQFWRYVVTN
jgi:hypothetical protein